MEKIAREQAEPRTDTLVWGKNAVTELLKSGGAVDTVYLADSLPQPAITPPWPSRPARWSNGYPAISCKRSAVPTTTRAWPPAPPRCSMPRWRICLPLLRPKAKHRSWCCAMG